MCRVIVPGESDKIGMDMFNYIEEHSTIGACTQRKESVRPKERIISIRKDVIRTTFHKAPAVAKQILKGIEESYVTSTDTEDFLVVWRQVFRVHRQ